MEQLSVELVDNPSQQQYEILSDGIRQHSTEEKGFQERSQHGAFFVKEGEQIVGGVGFYVNLGSLEIEKFWVDKKYRSQKIGSLLLSKVEEEGKRRDCRFATLGTGDWEGLGFYLKHKYTVEFKRGGYDNNSTYYFLRKDL